MALPIYIILPGGIGPCQQPTHQQDPAGLSLYEQVGLTDIVRLTQPISTYSNWPLATGILTHISDLNADGYFNAAYLQIFQMGYNGSVYVGLDENPYDDTTAPSSCSTYSCRYDSTGGQWQMYVYAEVIEINWDYSIFTTKTVVLADEIDKVRSGTSTLDNLLDIIEGVVGYISCDGIENDQVDVFDYVHSFSYFKTNTCTFAVLARYLNGYSLKEIIEDGNKRLQFRASKIREEWWKPFYHASISNSSEDHWLSGQPNLDSSKLIGWLDYPKDKPELTLFAGFINTTQNPEIAFTQLVSATDYYDNGLDYNLDPLPFTSSYNSNGFAKGLVDLVGTITPVGAFGAPGMSNTVDISINSLRFPGLFKPVPKSEFGF